MSNYINKLSSLYTEQVLDPLLDHIGNVQNWTAVSVQFLI